MDDTQGRNESVQYWDDQASTFDDEPDHGLRDPVVRHAWMERLAGWLPKARARVLDIGCGTGSVSLLMASLGHEVTGIDWAPAMIARAEVKAAASDCRATFRVMDASAPQFAGGAFDVILCRHLLWALPEPEAVLRRWTGLLAPGGRLVLVEGFWHTGGGLRADKVLAALPSEVAGAVVQTLSDDAALWGSEVSDERYAVIADLVE